jgi:L-alanine-DL-glutamate epimerase-like enolase superfamily enzyme
MTKPTDIRIVGATLYLLPVETRVPLKFGPETLTRVTCARVRVTVEDRAGRRADGWGETPLSVQWVWPSTTPYAARLEALTCFCRAVGHDLLHRFTQGHAFEVSLEYQHAALPRLWRRLNRRRDTPDEPIPWLAALVCFSPYDLALHDAFGRLVGRPVFETFTPEFLNRDLSAWLTPARGAQANFAGRFPADFLLPRRRDTLRAWHLVGGLDPLDAGDLTGKEPQDGHPVLLADWIRRDGLKCLKLKLRGDDAAWDFARIVRVGAIALAHGVEWLSVDFNCTVREPAYVNAILDRLRDEYPRLYGLVLYVEQPFPYDLEAHRLEVHSVAARKPLFLDESAHDWKLVRLGRELGWTGVALKTCKTLSGALLSACWAQAHGMTLMVQDLTNPMLAQIPHLLLAAHVETIMGVETNAMQFYPAASHAEAQVHPGLYQRRHGVVNLASVQGPGLGYRLEEIARELPPPDWTSGPNQARAA